MLLTKITYTQHLVSETIVAQEEHKKRRQITEFVDLVQKNLPLMQKTINSICLIQSKFPGQMQLSDMKRMLSQIEQLCNQVMNKPSKEQFYSMIQAFEKLELEAKKQWSSIAKRNHQEVKKAVSALKHILKEDTSFDGLLAVFTQFESLWPISEANMNHYLAKVQEAKEKIASLEVNETVQSFLDKVLDQKATLDDLNKEILDWLNAQQLTNKLYISFR